MTILANVTNSELSQWAAAIEASWPDDDSEYRAVLRCKKNYTLPEQVSERIAEIAPELLRNAPEYDGPKLVNPRQMTKAHYVANKICAAMRAHDIPAGDWLYRPMMDVLETVES